MAQDDDDELTVEVPSTLRDNVAFLIFVSRTPSRVLLQAALFVATGLWIMLMVILIGTLGAAFEPRAHTNEAVKDYLAGGWFADVGPSAKWIALLCLAGFLANLFFFVPRHCRLLARRLMAGYPELYAAGTDQALRTRFLFDKRGITASTRDERVYVAWRGIRRLIETRRHLFLMTGQVNAFVLPVDALGASRLADIRSFVARAIAPPT